VGALLTNQLQVSLVDQCGGLKGMVGTLSPHVAGSQPSEFPINNRNEIVEDVPIPLAQLL